MPKPRCFWIPTLAIGASAPGAATAQSDPLPAFTTRLEISTAVNDPTFIRAIDFDGDGDIDIVSTGQDRIRLLLSDGAPIPSFEEVAVWEFDGGGISVAVADLDGDGDLDIVSSMSAATTVFPVVRGLRWHENLGG